MSETPSELYLELWNVLPNTRSAKEVELEAEIERLLTQRQQILDNLSHVYYAGTTDLNDYEAMAQDVIKAGNPVQEARAEIKRLRKELDRAASLLRGETVLRNERDALRSEIERLGELVKEIVRDYVMYEDVAHEILAKLRGEES